MRVLICGGRYYNDLEEFHYRTSEVLWKKGWHHPKDPYRPHRDVVIISGMAKGADTLATKYAKINSLILAEFPADWNKYGKSAGYIRNKEMLEKGKPDLVIAFPGGKGTAMMINLARKAGVEVIEIATTH